MLNGSRVERWFPLIAAGLLAYPALVALVQGLPAQATAALLLVLVIVALALPGKK